MPRLGICLTRGDDCTVDAMPKGQCFVMVCEIERRKNVLNMLNLKKCHRDICRQPVTFPLLEPQKIELTLRPECPSDPPINIHPLRILFDAIKK